MTILETERNLARSCHIVLGRKPIFSKCKIVFACQASFFPDFIDLLFLDILHKCTHIIYCLSPNFRGKNIQSFTNKYDAGYRFFIESPYKLRKFFSISSY